MYQTVVVALDGTSVAEAALPGALTFARQAGATLKLLSVLDAPDALVSWSRREAPDGWIAARGDEIQSYLDGIAARMDYPGVETRVAIGEPLREIQREIEQVEQPLLVMARRPRSAMRERFSRGLCTRIARHAACPLVIVSAPDSSDASAEFSLDSVLVPLDGSHHAERVLPALSGDVLRPGGIDLHLLRVIETAAWHGSSQAVMYTYNLDRYIADMRAIATPYLSKMHDRLAPVAERVSCEVRVGRVAEQICLAADEQDVDLIAMSTHGRSGIERFLLGSVAEAVVTEAHRPVLLVRAAA